MIGVIQLQVTSHALFKLLPDIEVPKGMLRLVRFDEPLFKRTPSERSDDQRRHALNRANATIKRKHEKIAEERKLIIIGQIKRFGPKDMLWISLQTKIPYKAVRLIVLNSVEKGEIVKLNASKFYIPRRR